MKQSAIPDNELIAIFMGFVEHPNKAMYWKPEDNRFSNWLYKDSLSNFETSWDWLMPVLERIWMKVPIDVREINNEGLAIFEIGLFSDIQTVYKAVVEFIKWYNKQAK